MTAVSVLFVEESEPILLTEDFYLQDFDSDDILVYNVTLTLTDTIDVTSEGVRMVTNGGIVIEEQVLEDEYTKVYTLYNGSSFSHYQEVC